MARGAIAFVDGYQQGMEQARRERKPMMVFFTAPWCQYCHQMAEEAFNQAQVVNLSQRFLCVLVNADAEPAVCQRFGVRAYPTIQFVTSDGLPLNRVVGKRQGHQLVIDMQTALQSVARHDADRTILR